jgi:hypothetical protein
MTRFGLLFVLIAATTLPLASQTLRFEVASVSRVRLALRVHWLPLAIRPSESSAPSVAVQVLK